MAKGLTIALERIKRQTAMNDYAGNESYRPVLIFMSDGNATDGTNADRLVIKIREMSENGELNVVPIAISTEENIAFLRRMTRDSVVYKMNTDREFENVFEMITRKIHNATMVISMDEGEKNIANDVPEDIPSTMYGEDHMDVVMDDYGDFCNAMMNS